MPKKHEEDRETPRNYLNRIFEAKKSGEEWANDIPLDMNVLWADQGKLDTIIKNEIAHKRKEYGMDFELTEKQKQQIKPDELDVPAVDKRYEKDEDDLPF